MVSIENSEINNLLEIKMLDNNSQARVVLKPFYDPKKILAIKS